MFGRVTSFDSIRGYGFIRGKDGNTYFIHKSKLQGEHIEAGYYVYFKTYQNDRSDYNAENINVIEATTGRKYKHG